MSKNIERRSIIRAAAWATPVIAAVAVAPLAAASTPAVCEPRTVVYDPRDYTDHRGPEHNAFAITVDVSAGGVTTVTAVAIRDYAGATALNVSGILFAKTNGVRVGDVKAGAQTTCNPSMVQVDGNNVHWYSHVNGGQGGFQ